MKMVAIEELPHVQPEAVVYEIDHLQNQLTGKNQGFQNISFKIIENVTCKKVLKMIMNKF